VVEVRDALEELASFALSTGLEAGAAEVEAYVESARTTAVQVSGGKAEEVNRAVERGVGVRLVCEGGRMGFAYISGFDTEPLTEAVCRAVEAARRTEGDRFAGLPEPASPTTMAGELGMFDPAVESLSLDEKIDLARELEARALDWSNDVKAVEAARYEDRVAQVHVANTHGVSYGAKSTTCTAHTFLIAKHGDKGTLGLDWGRERSLESLKSLPLGEEAARRASVAARGRPIKSEQLTVVFDPWAALDLLSCLGRALQADQVQRGLSFLADSLDEQIASPIVNVCDDGLRPGRPRSSPCDDEGVPRRRTQAVREGRLCALLHDSHTSRRAGGDPAGNSTRSTYRSMPRVGVSNLYIEPGALSQEEIIGGVQRGLYVVSTTNTGGVNHVTGDYSVAATGILIENGELTAPVDPVTLAGTVPDLLKRCVAVGADLKWTGNLGTPTIAVEGVVVAGK